MGKLERRVYACSTCGQQIVITTNHENSCFPQCRGECYTVIARWPKSMKIRHSRLHTFVSAWDGLRAPDLVLVD